MLKMLGLKFIIEQDEYLEFQRRENEAREYAELIGQEYEATLPPPYTKVITDKLAIRLSEISTVAQYYRKINLADDTLSEDDGNTIRGAFANLEDFSFDSIPLLSIEMKSGNTVYDVMGTIEFLLKKIEDAENTN